MQISISIIAVDRVEGTIEPWIAVGYYCFKTPFKAITDQNNMLKMCVETT